MMCTYIQMYVLTHTNVRADKFPLLWGKAKRKGKLPQPPSPFCANDSCGTREKEDVKMELFVAVVLILNLLAKLHSSAAFIRVSRRLFSKVEPLYEGQNPRLTNWRRQTAENLSFSAKAWREGRGKESDFIMNQHLIPAQRGWRMKDVHMEGR